MRRVAGLVAAMLVGSLVRLAPAAEETFVNVPVVINILKDAGISEDDARKAIERANEIWKQAKIKFTVNKVNKDVAPPGNGDAKLDLAERGKAREDGAKELPDGKGIKVTFAEEPIAGEANTNGVAVHKNPVVIVRKNPKTGDTVAHEIGHVLTLHDLYDAADKDKLMYGYSSGRTDTKIPDDKKQEVKDEAAKRAPVEKKETTTPSAPSQPQPAQRSLKAPDSLPPRPPGEEYKNIDYAMMTSVGDETDFHFRLFLGGIMPGSAWGEYRLLFDTDNNPSTGTVAGSIPGVDRVAHVLVYGNLPSVQVYLGDGISTPWYSTTGWRISEPEFVDPEPGAATATPRQDVIDFSLPKSLLGFSGDSFFDVFYMLPDSSTADFQSRLFMYDHLNGPQLQTIEGFVNPLTDPLHVIGWGYTPWSLVDITLDDRLIATLATDGSGSLFAPLSLPHDLTDDWYFVTGQDRLTGEFGFSVVNVQPVPLPGAIAGGLALAVLAAVRRRK